MADHSPAGSRLSESLLPRELVPRELLRTAGVSRWNAVRGIRVGLSAATLFLLLTGANLATPLYPLLQQRLGLTPADSTVLFTVYVFALVPVLVAVGHWSDHLGRRALLLPAVALAAAGDALFATGGGLGQLAAGRAVQGISVGLATGAAAAALTDLLPDRPALAARLTLAASAGGVAAGPVAGGILSQAGDPVLTPFLLHAAALLALCLPLAVLHPRRPAAGRGPVARRVLRPRRLSLPGRDRGEFLLAAAAGFVSYAVFGIYLSLAPAYTAGLLHTSSRVVGGLVAALLLGASAAAQLVVPASRSRWTVPLGMAGLAAGLAAVVAAGYTGRPSLLFAGSLLGGACQGVAFRAWFTTACAAMDPARRGSQLSTFYVITYLGSTVPVLGVGVLAQHLGVRTAVAVFAAAAGAACLALAAAAACRSGRR